MTLLSESTPADAAQVSSQLSPRWIVDTGNERVAVDTSPRVPQHWVVFSIAATAVFLMSLDSTLIPIGGVSSDTIAAFIRAGAFAVMAGAALLDDAVLRPRAWQMLTARARALAVAANNVDVC